MPIPLIFYGDGPRLPSGLARIARDVLLRVLAEEEALGVVVHQVGVDPPDGWHWQGWPFWGFQPDARDQGRAAMHAVVAEVTARYGVPPIIWMFMDPSRCYDLTRQVEGETLDARFWAYFPIDSENINGRIAGPAAEAVWSCDRVLGYGRYGAEVLHETLNAQLREKTTAAHGRGMARAVAPPVNYLPHGLDASWHPGVPLEAAGEGFARWRIRLDGRAWILGAVATNQIRKDLALLFATAAVLKRQGRAVGVWLHTDRLTNAWDVGQLCLDFGFKQHEVCVSTADEPLTDEQLAARYGASDVMLGVGLGEGFGYPLVESLACGTPTVHGRFAGGIELLPRGDWLVEPSAWRLESCYAVKRPVLSPVHFAEAAARAAAWKRDQPQLCAAYCAGAVSYLQWDVLWPRWRSWIRQGIREEQQREGAIQVSPAGAAPPPSSPTDRANDAGVRRLREAAAGRGSGGADGAPTADVSRGGGGGERD